GFLGISQQCKRSTVWHRGTRWALASLLVTVGPSTPEAQETKPHALRNLVRDREASTVAQTVPFPTETPRPGSAFVLRSRLLPLSVHATAENALSTAEAALDALETAYERMNA